VALPADHEEEDTLFAAITYGTAAYLINERGRAPSVMAARLRALPRPGT